MFSWDSWHIHIDNLKQNRKGLMVLYLRLSFVCCETWKENGISKTNLNLLDPVFFSGISRFCYKCLFLGASFGVLGKTRRRRRRHRLYNDVLKRCSHDHIMPRTRTHTHTKKKSKWNTLSVKVIEYIFFWIQHQKDDERNVIFLEAFKWNSMDCLCDIYWNVQHQLKEEEKKEIMDNHWSIFNTRCLFHNVGEE